MDDELLYRDRTQAWLVG